MENTVKNNKLHSTILCSCPISVYIAFPNLLRPSKTLAYAFCFCTRTYTELPVNSSKATSFFSFFFFFSLRFAIFLAFRDSNLKCILYLRTVVHGKYLNTEKKLLVGNFWREHKLICLRMLLFHIMHVSWLYWLFSSKCCCQ